jgi:hypothetical protein
MSQSFVQVTEAGTSTIKKMDAFLTGNAQYRETVVIGHGSLDSIIAEPSTADPSANAGALPVRPVASSTIVAPILVSAGTNLTSYLVGAYRVFSLHGFNVADYVVYVKLYNKASAPVLASDIPRIVLSIQGGQANDWRSGNVTGADFPLGVAFAVVKGIGHADTTAVAAQDCLFNLEYK